MASHAGKLGKTCHSKAYRSSENRLAVRSVIIGLIAVISPPRDPSLVAVGTGPAVPGIPTYSFAVGVVLAQPTARARSAPALTKLSPVSICFIDSLLLVAIQCSPGLETSISLRLTLIFIAPHRPVTMRKAFHADGNQRLLTQKTTNRATALP
jgi:hypothetical protein